MIRCTQVFIYCKCTEAFELIGDFIPTGYPPHKEACSLTSGSGESMPQLAVRDLSLFQVAKIEVKRKGTTYTGNTLTELKAVLPAGPFVFIIYTAGVKDMAEF